MFAGLDPRAPAAAPEGRFHHSGQRALYTSLSEEGTAVAIRRYLAPDDPQRVLVPLTVAAERVADLRGRPELSVVWQDLRPAGVPSPTWALSEAARADGAQAILYSSRSRPDLTHFALLSDFDRVITTVGEARPWMPGE